MYVFVFNTHVCNVCMCVYMYGCRRYCQLVLQLLDSSLVYVNSSLNLVSNLPGTVLVCMYVCMYVCMLDCIWV